jgi:hypothetical protein
MDWIKKGIIYNTEGNVNWSKSHAQVPKADLINENLLRIYYGTRDSLQRTRTGYIEINPFEMSKVSKVSKEPVLDLGRMGTFDDCGAMPSCIVNLNSKKYLYYTGWNTDKIISYKLAIGLAISDDGGISFNKVSEGPIMDRNLIECISLCQPHVIAEKDKWMMWYSSFTKWEMINGKLEPFYNIKYAESGDGIRWENTGITCIDYDETCDALGNPFVFKENNLYKMYFSFRRNIDYRTNRSYSYRIGYAESEDGITWKRITNSGIDVSKDGWDSEMICYPNLITIGNKRYMFYNGNGFGKTGFGYAISDINE